MLTNYTVTELLVARQPLRWRHPSGRPVNGSLGARGCPERRALALGLLILRAQRRADRSEPERTLRAEIARLRETLADIASGPSEHACDSARAALSR